MWVALLICAVILAPIAFVIVRQQFRDACAPTYDPRDVLLRNKPAAIFGKEVEAPLTPL